MGAAEQPSLAVGAPSRNQRVTRFPALESAVAALSVNLLKIKERQKSPQLKKNILTSFSARSLCSFCISSPDRPHKQTTRNRVKPRWASGFVTFSPSKLQGGATAHPIGRFSWPQKLMALARITSLRAEVRPMANGTDRRISESTGAELSFASPWRVPKLGKSLSESKPSPGWSSSRKPRVQ
jgi:hypothetical protein